MLVKYNRSDREAAHVFALANMAAFDVANACLDAKLAYYFIRPSQADRAGQARNRLAQSSVVSERPLLLHGRVCDGDRERISRGKREPNGNDRGGGNVAGIRAACIIVFDCKAGQELGRQVAQQVLRVSGNSRSAIPLD